MKALTPIIGDLVLVGGGHAHVAVLKQFAMHPLPGLRVTLVTKDIRTPYSGMLPGFVEGVWNDDDLHIDLAKLAQMANARLIDEGASGFDLEAKTMLFANRPPLRFDILSLNIGGQPDLDSIAGAREYAIPVKPIALFQSRLKAIIDQSYPQKIAVIGGGAAGCELALALSKRWFDETGSRPDLAVFGRHERLMPQMAEGAAALMSDSLHAVNAACHLGCAVSRIDDRVLTLDDGTKHDFDACFLVSAVRAPAWLADTGLTLDDNGFVAVEPSLQSTSHPFVFAAGDVATIQSAPRPKAGVFAVRAGVVLGHNLRQFALGAGLRKWKPQKRYLALIGTGDGKAIASRGDRAHKSWLWWRLKCWIDRRWMAKYQDLKMPPPPAPAPLSGIYTPRIAQGGALSNDPVFDAMRCMGCGAKTGHETLANAMQDAIDLAVSMGADPALMPDPGLGEDSAVIPAHDGASVQSVDVISQIVSDPFVFGQIAAVHALSDLYAANAVPKTALAIINLSAARADLQQNQLTQILAGGLIATSAAGVKLIGGHTSEGDTISAGYSVTGHLIGAPVALRPEADYVLVLTKPLGSGVIMAGHMQLAASAPCVAAAIDEMKRCNDTAAIAIKAHASDCWITDVTGFGLARHAQNLIDRAGVTGATIDLANLPILSGASALLARGIKSSLHDQNHAAVRLADNPQAEILFDPQTSGGLLAIIEASCADAIIDDLTASGHKAAIIGTINHNKFGLGITGELAVNDDFNKGRSG